MERSGPAGAGAAAGLMSESGSSTGQKVALFIPSMAAGGAQRVFLTIANALHARGHSVDMVLAMAAGEFLDEISPGVNIVDLGAPRMARAVPRLVSYLRRERPVSLLSTLPHANLAAVAARRLARVPTRVFVREANTPSKALQSGFKSRAMASLLPLCYRAADGVIAVSQGVARDAAALGNLEPGRIHVIPNPVDVDEIRRRAALPLNHRWFAPGEPPVILGVGRLIPQKDFHTLIRALKHVRSTRPCRLVILGEGPDRAELEGFADGLGVASAVEFPGYVSNPFAFMARADVFALTSAWEGMPNVLIQAIACGCPSVSTDCPSGPREILRDGRDGRLVAVGDALAMGDAILKTLQDPLDSQSLQRRAADFDVDKIVGGYLDLLLGTSSRPFP